MPVPLARRGYGPRWLPAGSRHAGTPPVVRGVRFLPQHPDPARALGKQVLARKAHGHGEALGALADQHHVAGVFDDRLGHLGHVLDVAHRADRAGTPRRPVHAAGVELDDALLVRQTPEADRIVFRIVLRAADHLDRGVERVAAAAEQVERTVEIRQAVTGRHDDVARRTALDRRAGGRTGRHDPAGNDRRRHGRAQESTSSDLHRFSRCPPRQPVPFAEFLATTPIVADPCRRPPAAGRWRSPAR